MGTVKPKEPISYSPKEISESTGIPRSTVNHRLKRKVRAGELIPVFWPNKSNDDLHGARYDKYEAYAALGCREDILEELTGKKRPGPKAELRSL